MIATDHGRIVKTTGDGMLVEFAGVIDAVTCSVAIQRGMITRNSVVPEDKRILFRVGINVGSIDAFCMAVEAIRRSFGKREMTARALPHDTDDVKRLQTSDHGVGIGRMVVEHSDGRLPIQHRRQRLDSAPPRYQAPQSGRRGTFSRRPIISLSIGRSRNSGVGYDYDIFAADLDTVLTTLDLTGVSLVGHSMGSGEIRRCIGKYGTKRVRKAVLIGTPGTIW
jgi:hypothetical protein